MSTYSEVHASAAAIDPRSSAAAIFGSVSGWLVLAMVVGASIAMYDGLHRKWMTELETFGPVVALTYSANKAAWLFAGAVLPLMVLHGRKLRFSLVESLLLWFVLCTTAYTKDFAYLKIPGVPIFVTDVMLVVTMAGCMAWSWVRSREADSSGLKPLGMTKIKDLYGTTKVVP
jgi:hypothetical protein